MSENQTPRRRISDGDIETRLSVIETRQDFLTETVANISKSLEKHIQDEENTMKAFTAIIGDMNKTVIINTEALRHLASTFVTHTNSTEKLSTQFETMDKRIDKHDVEVAKMESMSTTIAKIATVVSVIIGAIWALVSKFL